MKWIKASERLSEHGKWVNAKHNNTPVALHYNEAYGFYYDERGSYYLIENVLWLDETTEPAVDNTDLWNNLLTDINDAAINYNNIRPVGLPWFSDWIEKTITVLKTKYTLTRKQEGKEAIEFGQWLVDTNYAEKETWGKYDPPSIPSMLQLYKLFKEDQLKQK